MTRKTKENNMIPLRDQNSFLKNIYESPIIVDNIEILSKKEADFSLEDIFHKQEE